MPSSFPLLSITLFFIFIIDSTSAQKCSNPSPQRCPPFTSPLPFPFSSSPDCGHPSFQIQCSSLQSFISINNFNFSILDYKPNSTSLHLSLIDPSPLPYHCPNRSIDLSGSPFRFSDTCCSKLALLNPCPSSNLSNNSKECELLKRPIHLLNGCEPKHAIDSEKVCKDDILVFLQKFLKSGGIHVEWDEDEDGYFSNCTHCRAAGNRGVCGFDSLDSKKPFLCFSSEAQNPWIYRDKPNRIVILSAFLVFMCVLVVVAIIKVSFWCRKMKTLVNEEDPTTLFLHRYRSANLLPPVFTYEELESSTNLFDPRRKIGDGGFGSVYLGQLYDGRIVAVKKLHRPPTMATSSKSFCNEILILSSIDHPNLVKLHGYCSDPKGLLLVYDYVPNGTLADHLHGSKSSFNKGSLTWQTRVEIALQTAMALEYLHFSVEPAIVHRDITSSNIFLEKDMRIKVGDFGLSRLLIFPESSSTSASSSNGFICTGPQGTPGYLDPDYHRSFRLTEKSDVYSFGVILFELISGMKAVDLSREKRDVSLADLVVSKIQMGCLYQVVDPVLILEGEAMGTTVDAIAELAFRCVAADKDDRPDAKEIVIELRRIRGRTRGGHRSSNVAPEPSSKGGLVSVLGT